MHCFSCGFPARFVPCEAQKVWEYPSKLSNDKDCHFLKVYHFGNHTCLAKKPENNKTLLQEAVNKNPNLGSVKLAKQQIIEAIDGDQNWDDIQEIADAFTDTNKIHNIKTMHKADIDLLGHSFDAVGKLKEKCDKKDIFYIYKINNKNHNNEPSYVFKTSKTFAEIGLKMDKSSSHPLSNEYCFFDGKHDRCKGYKTPTLWVYHPTLRQVLKLATMEVESESSKHQVIFWNLWNEVLQKVSGKP